MSRLDRILQFAAFGPAGMSDSGHSLDLLASQRVEVEAVLDRQQVYGFNTLLGHLDYLPMGRMQKELLTAHLVGVEQEASGQFLNLVTGVKLEQLQNGGTGLHPETFEALRSVHFEAESAFRGAWRASYGSGDVVPGAWWLHHVLKELHLSADNLHPGDVIALINGNFISTAQSIDVLLASMGFTARLIPFLQQTCLLNHSLPVPEGWGRQAAQRFSAANGRVPQVGVSSRDARPVVELAIDETANLARAVGRRVDAVSGNPIFVEGSERGLTVLSQSSFLGPGMTATLMSHRVYVHFAAAAAVAAFHQVQSDGDAPEVLMRGVQPLKVSVAALQDMASFNPAPNFYFQESQGVEDLADGSLLVAHALAEVIDRAHEVLDSCGSPSHGDVELLSSMADDLDISPAAVRKLLAPWVSRAAS